MGKVLRSSFAATFVSAVVGFVILPRVLRGIGVRNYGEWATLAAILAVGQLGQSGVSTEIARRVASARGDRDDTAMALAVRQGVTVLAGVAFVLELAALATARPVVDLVFRSVNSGGRGQLTLLVIGVVSLFAIGLVGNGFFAVLTGLQRSDFGIWSGVASIVAAAIATLAGIAGGLGLWALFLADCVQLAVSWVGPLIGVRRLAPHVRFGLVRMSRSAVLGFLAMPAMLVVAQASDVFDSQVDKLVLTHSVGPRSSAMFQIGVNLVQLVRGLALVPLSVMLAGTAELHRSNPRRLRRLELLASASTQAIAAVSAGGLVLFADPFVARWLGPGYSNAALAVRVLALAALLNMWSAPWSYYAIGRRRYHYVLIGAGVTLVVNAIATIVLTTHIGLSGALIGSVAGSGAGMAAARVVLLRWERGAWLTPALRCTAVVAVIVLPFVLAGVHVPATWPAMIGWGLAYLVGCALLLHATGSLPATLHRRRDGGVTFTWRDEPSAPPAQD